jgi:hypothetical protein
MRCGAVRAGTARDGTDWQGARGSGSAWLGPARFERSKVYHANSGGSSFFPPEGAERRYRLARRSALIQHARGFPSIPRAKAGPDSCHHEKKSGGAASRSPQEQLAAHTMQVLPHSLRGEGVCRESALNTPQTGGGRMPSPPSAR